jgi:phage terminase small subunit
MTTAATGPIRLGRASAAARAPTFLGEAGKALWRSLLAEYDLGTSGQLAQLLIACEQADVLDDVRAQIEADGRFIQSRFGQTVPHPAIEVGERASRLQLAAFRALELDFLDVAARRR